MLAILRPRESTLGDLRPNEHLHNAKVIFWNTLALLEEMIKVTKAKFSHHAAVLVELLEFISVNFTVDAVDTMKDKVNKIAEGDLQMKQDVKGAATKVDTVFKQNKCHVKHYQTASERD